MKPATPHSALRTPHSQSGVALVVTLILLSIITFMTVTFLVVSHSQQGSVATDTDQLVARLAADAALERAKAQLLASILATTNEFNYGLLVSTNYINPAGFLVSGTPNSLYTSPTNVNYNYPNGSPVTGNDALQNLANLLYDPRPPVFIVTNTLVANSNDFRFYLDLNRNGGYDPSGLQPLVVRNPAGALGFYALNGSSVPYTWPPPPNIQSNFFVGDPEWIGALRHPEFTHASDNPFIYRYAYIAVPVGQTLDINTIYNDAKQLDFNHSYDGFLRDQGILTSEINLAALLVDLNTNLWPYPAVSLPPFNFQPYFYNTNTATAPSSSSTGTAAEDAAALLRYRYNSSLTCLANVNVNGLFGSTGAVAFTSAPFDVFSQGPLMTGTWWPPPGLLNPNPTRVSGNYPWAGADNPNRFYSTQDLFDTNKTSVPGTAGACFSDRLKMAGTNVDSYNRYTFYRLLSQLGTDSAPEPPGKMNLNYCNVDNNGNVVPGMETNFIPWTPVQFFTNAAIRLLANAGYTTGTGPTNLLLVDSSGVTHLQIQLYPTNFYTPSVHRLFQLAANMYDATTNQSFRVATATTNGFPSVFRPVFGTSRGGHQAFIVGYQEVTDASILSLPQSAWVDLTAPGGPQSLRPFSMVYGLPLVVGAKKGFPNFNELAMSTGMQVTRKLEFRRQAGSQNGAIVETNQMYVVTISNVCGIAAWNSYATTYPRNLSISIIGMDTKAYLTDAQKSQSWLYYTNFTTIPTNQPIALNTWLGFSDANHAASSFRYPLWTNFLTLTNSQYLQKTTPPQFVPLVGLGNTFERPSGFQTPDWWLALTNRLRYALIDTSVTPNRIVDFVNLEACGVPVHITQLMGGGGCPGSYNASVNGTCPLGYTGPSDEWCTNTGSGVVPYGIQNQINVGLGTQPNNCWASAPANYDACDFFRAQFTTLHLGALHPRAGENLTVTNTFYAPFVPTFATNLYTSWQVNDPLVHYTIPDLTDPAAAAADPMATFGKGVLNERYHPWGGNPNKADSLATKWILALKDPVVPVNPPYGCSDDWDFPTNKFPNVGWLGRVHRGTPWQTVYLKSSPIDLPTWTNWTGNTLIVTNVGQFSTNMILPSSAVYYPVPTSATIPFYNGVAVYDAYFTLPTNDWHFLDLFTTALSDSATRGQLSINQTNLAAWSALLCGVCTLTNSVDASGNPILVPQVVQPAGVYNDSDATTWPPLVQFWKGINNTRTNFPNQVFHTLGDVLAAPVLTVASPFLNPNTPPSDPNYMLNLNDAAYERLPQQILGLLKCDHTPRFVIYSYGQALKPAPHSIYTGNLIGGGNFAGLCTNYQIMAEAATRAVVRIDGAPSAPHAVLESFNVLPPD